MSFTKELRNYGASITYEAADIIDAIDKALTERDAELATLRAENERLRVANEKMVSGLITILHYSETGSMIESVCEEALK